MNGVEVNLPAAWPGAMVGDLTAPAAQPWTLRLRGGGRSTLDGAGRLGELCPIMHMKIILGSLLACSLLAGASVSMAAEPAPGTTAKPATPESFQIRNQKFGDLLRPEDANSADGTRIVLYPAQAWKCMTWKLLPAGESAFALQNHFTSKTIAPAPAGGEPTAVIQVPLGKSADQRPTWQLKKLSDDLYQITETKSGKALTAVAADGGGVRVVLAPAGPGDEQKWRLIKTDPAKLTM
jgi:hypothetical protein